MSDSEVATFIGDVIGSRRAQDRQEVHDAIVRALGATGELEGVVDAGRVTVGDEFQGSFTTVGQALAATRRLRLSLLPAVDVRIGLGWGAVTTLDDETRDGPGWWAAREAIEWVKTAETKGVTARVRTAYRRDGSSGPDPRAVNAALLCRDQLLGGLDERARRVLVGLLAGRPQSEIAAAEGISPSAVSQRVRTEGLGLILLVEDELAAVGDER